MKNINIKLFFLHSLKKILNFNINKISYCYDKQKSLLSLDLD